MKTILLWGVVISLSCLIVFIIIYDKYYNYYVNNLSKGDSHEFVITKLGKPDKVLNCPKDLWWGYEGVLPKSVNSTCKKYYIYNGIFLKRWGIGFDKNDQVISKYFYISE